MFESSLIVLSRLFDLLLHCVLAVPHSHPSNLFAQLYRSELKLPNFISSHSFADGSMMVDVNIHTLSYFSILGLRSITSSYSMWGTPHYQGKLTTWTKCHTSFSSRCLARMKYLVSWVACLRGFPPLLCRLVRSLVGAWASQSGPSSHSQWDGRYTNIYNHINQYMKHLKPLIQWCTEHVLSVRLSSKASLDSCSCSRLLV